MFASSCNADKFSPWPCMGSTAVCRWFAALSHERDAVFHLRSYFGKEGLYQPMAALSAHASQFESATVRCHHKSTLILSIKRGLTHFCLPQGRPRISSFPPSSWDILHTLSHLVFKGASDHSQFSKILALLKAMKVSDWLLQNFDQRESGLFGVAIAPLLHFCGKKV